MRFQFQSHLRSRLNQFASIQIYNSIIHKLHKSSAPLTGHSTKHYSQSRCIKLRRGHYSNNEAIATQQDDDHNGQKVALVLGSSGTLGSTIASNLKRSHNCLVIGSDIHPPSKDRIDTIDAFIQLPAPMDTSNNDNDNDGDVSIDSIFKSLHGGIQKLCDGNINFELDVIICANGGFAMDHDIQTRSSNGDVDAEEASTGSVFDTMMKMNYYPVVAAGEIAKEYMTTSGNGLLVAFGAFAALSPAPGMIAYSSSKVATHYYVQSIGAMTGKALSKEHKIQRNSDMGINIRKRGRYLDSMSTLAMLPIMLDTTSNRDALPDEDFSRWTKPAEIANEIGAWVDTPEIRPHSGSLIKVITNDDKTNFTLAR